jgi:hypothetical protein
MNNLKVFIGFDSSNYGQELAFEVCKRSIQKYNKNIEIIKLVKQELIDKGLFKRTDKDGATEFTYTRFFVPYLSNYEGYSLFCDSDFLWNCNVQELFEKYTDENKALSCVMHKYENCNDKMKMDNQKQEWYPKKNWSSLMIFNNSHPSVKNLNLENVNTQTPKWLHRFEWANDTEIIEIPKSYNYLVDYYFDGEIKALHFTDGGPWHTGYENVSYSDLWLKYLNKNEESKMNELRNNNYL